jgi:AraC family transcriptional regulator
MISLTLHEDCPAVARYPRGASFGPRTLADFELVWMLAGSAAWRRLDEPAEHLLRPGQLLLLRPGMRDEIQWDRAVAAVHGYAHFRVEGGTGTGDWPLWRPTAPPAPLAALLSYLEWLGEQRPPGWHTRAEDVLATTVRTFVSGPFPPPRPEPEPAPLAAALDHVRREWARRVRSIPLAELAAAAQVSSAHLSRLFRQRYGSGPVTALEWVRLLRARSLLARSNLSVTEVARDCGYEDPLHFSRRFRARYGLSPRGYRTGAEGSAVDPDSLHAIARRVGLLAAG